MRTYSTKAKDVNRQWHVVDASGKTLGRLVSRIAVLLMGKHKPYYVPYLDTGVGPPHAPPLLTTVSPPWSR